MKNYAQGQTVRLTATFRDFDDVLVDPTNVYMYTQREADSVWTDESASAVHASTGIYHLDLDTADESGVWKWRIVGTGAAANVQQGQFYVTPMAPVDVDPTP